MKRKEAAKKLRQVADELDCCADGNHDWMIFALKPYGKYAHGRILRECIACERIEESITYIGDMRSYEDFFEMDEEKMHDDPVPKKGRITSRFPRMER